MKRKLLWSVAGIAIALFLLYSFLLYALDWSVSGEKVFVHGTNADSLRRILPILQPIQACEWTYQSIGLAGGFGPTDYAFDAVLVMEPADVDSLTRQLKVPKAADWVALTPPKDGLDYAYLPDFQLVHAITAAKPDSAALGFDFHPKEIWPQSNWYFGKVARLNATTVVFRFYTM